jgi:tetratricopeptide (TPR) repeat protein
MAGNVLEDLPAASSRALKDGKRDEAVSHARAAAKAFPHRLDVLQALAEALTHAGAYEYNPPLEARLLADGSLAEAAALLREAAGIDGNNYQLRLQLGNCLTALGDYGAAAGAIRRATDLYLPLIKPGVSFGALEDAEAISPTFFVIGSVKCGTTSLFDYVTSHPDVLPGVTKECHYFHHPERGLEWYLSHFPKRPAGGGRFVTGDFSASTINAHDAPVLLRQMVPGARLIVLARNPVDRAISHYYMHQRTGLDQRSLEAAMAEEIGLLRQGEVSDEYMQTQHGYLLIGLYARELERWLETFPRDQLLILLTEDMKRDPASATSAVFQHIGLQPYEFHAFKRLNEGDYGDADHIKVRRRLEAFFRKPNERFYELIGRRPPWEDAPAAVRMRTPPAASRARSLAGKERWAEAAAAWKQCLADAPEHPDAAWWRQSMSDALLWTGELDGAELGYRDLLKANPRSASGMEGLAMVALARKDLRGALMQFEQCIGAFPHHANRRQWLTDAGRAAIGCGDLERAEWMFRNLASEYPGEGAGPAGLARVAGARQDLPLAIALWEDCLSRFPAHPDRRWWLPALLHVLIDLGDTQRAEAIGDLIILEYPEEAAALASLARLESHKGNLAASAEMWEKCLTRFPAHPDRAWWLLEAGQVFLDRKMPGPAEKLFRHVTEEFPREARGIAGLALALGLQSRVEEAAALWSSCIERFPRHPDRSWWLPAYGHLLLDQGRTGEAEAVFRRMTEEFPGNHAGPAGMARAAYLQSDWRKAIQLIEDVMRRFPADANRPGLVAMHRNATQQLGAGTNKTADI